MSTNRYRGSLQPPLEARNGHTLKILLVCRVSDPNKQDERSPEDQAAWLQHWLEDKTDLPLDITLLAGTGSGERLERHELIELKQLIASGRFDLVLTEDLGRIARRVHTHLICERCVDFGTRLISLNDQVDTAQEGWEDRSIFSAWHHERSNRDTSCRIKRTHRARFLQGGCLPVLIYGYRKRPGARSDADVEKLPEAEAVYKEWFERLDRGESYSDIADWLNALNVPTGDRCRRKKWDRGMVRRVTHNWILKGIRFRNKRKSKRHNRTGRYRSEKADPSELLTRHVPHLAFFEEAYYDRVVAKVDARNTKYRRSPEGRTDPLAGRPRKRTRFPGQCIYCGVCGRPYHYGGHGQSHRLGCSGALDYRCWNAITLDGPLAAQRISDAVFAEIVGLEEFDQAFVEMVSQEASNHHAARKARLRELQADIERVDQEIGNLMRYIRGGDDSLSVREELQRLEREKHRLCDEKRELELAPSPQLVVPSVEELREMARSVFEGLTRDSAEFARWMRDLTAPIYVYPYRSCDGGHLVLRARFCLSLAHLLPQGEAREVLQEPLRRRLTVDLFHPPQRIWFREQVVARRAAGETEQEVARALGLTITAVQHAAALGRLMRQAGIDDPYVPVTEPPSDYGKLRRHRHRRYCFEPLPGYAATM